MSPARLATGIPSTQAAIIQGPNGALSISHDVAVPVLRAGHILVKVACIGLNPCDWKMPQRFPTPGCADGSDFTGIVSAVAEDVKLRWKVGDRVCGAVHGANPIDKEIGTFAEYVLVDAEFAWRVPKGMEWEEAAAAGSGVAWLTLGLVLRRSLRLEGTFKRPVREEEAMEVLVYAASTAVGTLATQLLRLFGHKPIGVCSPKHFDFVKSRGAVKVFDYQSPSCAQDIRTYTKNSLAYIIDPMADVRTMTLCYAAMGRAGGRYCALEAYSEDLTTSRRVVQPELIMGMSIFGKRVALSYGYEKEADPESRAFGVQWVQEVQEVLDEAGLKSHPVRILEGGYQGVLKGLDLLKQNQVSGEKLVVRLS